MNDNQNPSTATVSLKGSKLDRTISSILALGPLAVIAFVAVSCTTSLFAARYVFRGVSSWFTTETRTSVTASVEKVLPAFELKPLVVCDSGIGIVPRNRNGEPFPGVSGGLPSRDKAVLEFEYEGSAEYVVNLANAKSEQVGDSSHPKVRIEIDPPFVPNDSVAFSSAAKTDRYLATYGSDQKWRAWYLKNHHMFVFGAILQTAKSPELAKMAKEQTEVLVRGFVGALVNDPDKDVEIIWRDEQPPKESHSK